MVPSLRVILCLSDYNFHTHEPVTRASCCTCTYSVHPIYHHPFSSPPPPSPLPPSPLTSPPPPSPSYFPPSPQIPAFNPLYDSAVSPLNPLYASTNEAMSAVPSPMATGTPPEKPGVPNGTNKSTAAVAQGNGTLPEPRYQVSGRLDG